MRNEEGKIELQKKAHKKIMWRLSLFWLHALLPMSFFVVFFVYSLYPFQVTWMALLKIHNNIAMGAILCGDIMSKRSYEKLLQFNTD